MLADALEAVGIDRGDYLVRINNRKVLNGVLEAAEVREDQAEDVLRQIDKFDKVGRDGVLALLTTGRLDDAVPASTALGPFPGTVPPCWLSDLQWRDTQRPGTQVPSYVPADGLRLRRRGLVAPDARCLRDAWRSAPSRPAVVWAWSINRPRSSRPSDIESWTTRPQTGVRVGRGRPVAHAAGRAFHWPKGPRHSRSIASTAFWPRCGPRSWPGRRSPSRGRDRWMTATCMSVTGHAPTTCAPPHPPEVIGQTPNFGKPLKYRDKRGAPLRSAGAGRGRTRVVPVGPDPGATIAAQSLCRG